MSTAACPPPFENMTAIRGPINLKAPTESEEGDICIPDPEEVTISSLLSSHQLHILRFIRENVEACTIPTTFGVTTSDNMGPASQYAENVVQVSNASPEVSHHSYRLASALSGEEVRKFLQQVSRELELGPSAQKRTYRYHVRQKQESRSPSKLRKRRLEQALRSGNLFLNEDWHCCGRYNCFEKIGPDRCFAEYKQVNSMTKKQAKRYLISLYDQFEDKFRIGGQVVCSRFLAKCLHFSNDVQCSIKNTPKARGSAIVQSRPREVIRKTKRGFISVFIKNLAKMFGDAMPHKEQITLPVLNRKSLWRECEEAWKVSGQHGGDDALSKSYFYTVWRKFAGFVNVRKTSGFAVCSRCELLRDEMAKHLRDEETLSKLIEQHAIHLRFIEKERAAYEARQALAEQNPQKYCSIIIDGADQKNYGLPHFANNTKSDSGHKLKVKVVGVLEHVLRGEEWLSLFAMTEEYETGANHIVEVVHQALQRKKDKIGKLPPVLFVQVDNCIRENKNRYFMAYFQSLVHLGVFKMVQVSFLPIGHTHADIDQTFSSISSHLKINNAITLPELLTELRKCYARRVTASELRRVINYSGLCESSDCLSSVDSFTEYRYFRFLQQDGESTASLHGCACDVKVRDDDAWNPFPNSAAEGFLKFVPSFSSTPSTMTKQLFNEAQTLKCLDKAEERIKDETKLQSLRELQQKVFEVREESFHWPVTNIFELKGDYISSTSSAEQERESASGHVEQALRPNYGYDPDDFVAIATTSDPNTKFWIGRVKNVAEIDNLGRAKTVTIRWYVATGANPWDGKYKPAWRVVDGEQTVYEDTIDAASVLVRFEGLTTGKKLRVRDKKAIKQTLNEN